MRAALVGERWLSAARLIFCGATLARALWLLNVPGMGWPHAALSMPATLAAMAFSVWMVVRGWREVRRPRLLSVSAVVDAVGCFAALVPNALWPVHDYLGILRIPDVAAILIITIASGLRLSAVAVTYAAILNTLSFVVLVTIDASRAYLVFPLDAGLLALFAIYLATAILLAAMIAARTRKIVAQGAAQAVTAELARRRLGEILQDHHDVRSALSSASINAELARRATEADPHSASTEIQSLLDHLRDDLKHVGDLVTVVRERAYEEVRASGQRLCVDFPLVAAQVVAHLRRQFSAATISVENRLADSNVVVAGGQRTVERILINLLTNACEGDGERAAARVTLTCEPSERPTWVRVVVSDDGPGFPEHVLARCGQRAATTKKTGAGLGLLLVTGLVEANGGQVECANRVGGGASVRFELPGAAWVGAAPDDSPLSRAAIRD